MILKIEEDGQKEVKNSHIDTNTPSQRRPKVLLDITGNKGP